MPAAAARRPWRRRRHPSMSCPAGCPRSCSSPFAIGLEPMAPQWLTIMSKFGNHLPFYRQAEIFKRQGIDLDRGTVGNWVGRACFHLMPIINHMKAHLRGADRIFVALEARLRRDELEARLRRDELEARLRRDELEARLRRDELEARLRRDETRAPVLDPGRKATESGYFWAVVSDERGHGGVGPPIVLFHYAPGRGKQ